MHTSLSPRHHLFILSALEELMSCVRKEEFTFDIHRFGICYAICSILHAERIGNNSIYYLVAELSHGWPLLSGDVDFFPVTFYLEREEIDKLIIPSNTRWSLDSPEGRDRYSLLEYLHFTLSNSLP